MHGEPAEETCTLRWSHLGHLQGMSTCPSPALSSLLHPVLRDLSFYSLSNLNPLTSINSTAKPAVNELCICVSVFDEINRRLVLRYDLLHPRRGDAVPEVHTHTCVFTNHTKPV